MTGLKINNLSMRFDLPNGDAVQALKNVSLDIKTGEIMSVLGPSRLRQDHASEHRCGLSRADGRAGRAWRQASDRTRCGTRNGVSARRVVRVDERAGERGLRAEYEGAPRVETAKTVDHLLEVVGLQDFKEKAIYELSGGMQQRVALARCLANDPDVILMDEPLGALDALTREKMQGLVLKLWKETGKTIILITHSVEEALLLGERLLVMAPRPGRIHKEYRLPFAEMGVGADLREVKQHAEFGPRREEILSMIWDMEEEIMGRSEDAA